MSEADAILPTTIYDPNANIHYKRARFFGKGGFAKCYEIISVQNNRPYAGKIVSKKLMVKQHQKEKLTQEIQIHASLSHKNIVKFCSFFEDSSNIYIVLELCKKRSMMELLKRRITLTEPETRYYMQQILDGVHYLHQHKIIHRDLKLGNLFLNDELQVKIGDFGLATKIEFDGERKMTLCGTPNYIAPEILNKQGHSYEVDVWSIGCIMYTLLVGKPPFETKSLKETYSRIKKCQYNICATLSSSAKCVIMMMLQADATKRPKVEHLLKHEFIVNGYCPPTLPTSCLTMAPRFNANDLASRNTNRAVLSELGNIKETNSIPTGLIAGHENELNIKDNLLALRNLLCKLLKQKPILHKKVSDEMSDPAAQPTIWVSKWVDYSDKYGFGYQLSDDSVGVMFNDTTRLIMLANGVNVQYVDKNGEEYYLTMDNYSPHYEKKMKLLSYFSRYMREHLVKTGASAVKEFDSVSRTPYLHQWCRSTSGVLMQLNNGTLQINFTDHTKIIMCPLMAAITFIDEDESFRTFRFTTIEKYGCVFGLYDKMKYAYDKIMILLNDK